MSGSELTETTVAKPEGMPDSSLAGYSCLEELLEAHLPPEPLEQAKRILYGYNQGSLVQPLELPEKVTAKLDSLDAELKAFTFRASTEQLRAPRVTRVALIQNEFPAATTAPYPEQRASVLARITALVDAAGEAGANVVCLQEAWPMPFAFCTREREWSEFAEPVDGGPSTAAMQVLAKKHGMVVVSPVLERDVAHGGVIWNTAVVIGTRGEILGKHRKNHIPRVSPFDEANYYREGDTGHPVFETEFGRIAINICYGRHVPLNWLGFALNGAEIVFNPSATVGALSEPMWGVEGRCAAIANGYFVASINRVGWERFPNAFTIGDGKPATTDLGPFYGSSYIAAPDASRSPSLARNRDGLLLADVDLNLCRQVHDRWGFRLTSRYPIYAKLLNDYIQPDFQPQIVKAGESQAAVSFGKPGTDGE